MAHWNCLGVSHYPLLTSTSFQIFHYPFFMISFTAHSPNYKGKWVSFTSSVSISKRIPTVPALQYGGLRKGYWRFVRAGFSMNQLTFALIGPSLLVSKITQSKRPTSGSFVLKLAKIKTLCAFCPLSVALFSSKLNAGRLDVASATQRNHLALI